MWDFYKNGDAGKRWDSVKGGGMSNFFCCLEYSSDKYSYNLITSYTWTDRKFNLIIFSSFPDYY